ncbi:helix-turn-helix domain-containing protein [Amycolatopsis kentuckyensis]|uniref:helix-turn-helix domain-containing protein n=1 Tax=Amycolatopsis kentuckyensis TaxID=218823 RepID=UPI0035695FBB
MRTYLDTGTTIAKTASTLGIHPNTVKYRIRKVEQLTGLSLTRMSELILQVAIVVHDLDPARFDAENHGAR